MDKCELKIALLVKRDLAPFGEICACSESSCIKLKHPTLLKQLEGFKLMGGKLEG